MDAAAQKTLQDTVAALQRNDPALKEVSCDMFSKSGRCGAFRGQIGAAGCQAICSALEGNTRVVTWSHICTLSRVLHAAAYVTCGRR